MHGSTGACLPQLCTFLRLMQLLEVHGPPCPVQGIENKRTRELSEEELTTLRDEVEKYTIEGDLRRFNALNIKRLKEIQCYRGRRHIAVSATVLLQRAHTCCMHVAAG